MKLVALLSWLVGSLFLGVLAVDNLLSASELDPNCTSNNLADCIVEMPCPDGIMCCLCCGEPRSIKYGDGQARRMRLHLSVHEADECGWCEGDTVILCEHGEEIARKQEEE